MYLAIDKFDLRHIDENGSIKQLSSETAIPTILGVVRLEVIGFEYGFTPAGKNLETIDLFDTLRSCENIENIISAIRVRRKGVRDVDIISAVYINPYLGDVLTAIYRSDADPIIGGL